MSEVLSATATTFEGATSAAIELVERDEGPSGAMRERPVGQVVAVVSPRRPGSWTRIIAWGVAPWIRPSVTAL